MPAILPYFNPQPIMQTPFALPAAVVNVAYSTTVVAAGGTPPYTYAITSDTPDTGNWLTIAPSTGVLSGTPTTAETESVTIVATDNIGTIGVPRTFSLVVNPVQAPLSINTINLPYATQNINYTQQLAATGSGNFTWTLTSAITPAGTGLSLSSAGLISGSPPNLVNTATSPSSISIPVKLTDNNTGSTATRTYSLAVMAQPLLTYSAPTDQTIRAEPAVPTWGGYNSILTDDISGYRILRVTDGAASPDYAPKFGHTFLSNDGSAESCKWSALGNYFVILGDGNEAYFYKLNKSTFQVTAPGLHVVGTISWTAFFLCQWDPVLDTIVYGTSSTNRNIVYRMDVTTGVQTSYWDLTGPAATYGQVSDLSVADNLNLAATVGAQDVAHAAVYLAQGVQHLIDTSVGTLDGVAIPGWPASSFGIHNTRLGQDGRYLRVTTNNGSAPGHFYFDILTNTYIGHLPSGTSHQANAWGLMVNNGQTNAIPTYFPTYEIRDDTTATGLTSPQDLYQPPAGQSVSGGVGSIIDNYVSWCNQRNNMRVPVMCACVDQSSFGYPLTGAYEQEIFAITTNGGQAANTVYRLMHHFGEYQGDFFDGVHPTISRDGRYAMLCSNYRRTLGNASTTSFTATTTTGAGANVLSAVSPNNGNTAPVGALVSGPGIPANTVIASISIAGATRTMNNNATASASGVTITYGNARKDVFIIELK